MTLKIAPDQTPSPSLDPSNHVAKSQAKQAPKVLMPAHEIPSYRVAVAFEKGLQRKFLINTWGGLGDQICAEPAIRFALKTFNKCEISLASTVPSLYSHLKGFKEIFDTNKQHPKWDEYQQFQTITPPGTLVWEFFSHMITHCVDFPSMCMWRCQLPIEERIINMPDFLATPKIKPALDLKENAVVIHAGAHWQSKTFPADWWKSIEQAFIAEGFTPVLIGHKVDGNVGFVDFAADEKSIDLRGQLSLTEFICLLKNSCFLFSNDSSPVHAASSGRGFVGFVATCKHPDFILHWRKNYSGEINFAWNAHNFGKDGIWNHIDYNPAQDVEVSVENIGDELLRACLPTPSEVIEKYAYKRDQYRNLGEFA
jgi:hypothetical protein